MDDHNQTGTWAIFVSAIYNAIACYNFSVNSLNRNKAIEDSRFCPPPCIPKIIKISSFWL